MLINANFKPYPTGLKEVTIPLEDEKYIKFSIKTVTTPEEIDEEGNILEPEKDTEFLTFVYFDGIEEQEILDMSKAEVLNLHTIIRDLARQMN